MATSAGGRGLLIAFGALGGGLFGFWLQDRWMQQHRVCLRATHKYENEREKN
jgi:hypothetical protein